MFNYIYILSILITTQCQSKDYQFEAYVSLIPWSGTVDEIFFRLCNRTDVCGLFESVPAGWQVTGQSYSYTYSTREDINDIYKVQIVHPGSDALCIDHIKVNGIEYEENGASWLDWPHCIEDEHGGGCDTVTIILPTNDWNSAITVPCEFGRNLYNTYSPTPVLSPTLKPTISPTLSPTIFGECGFAQISGFKYPLDYCFGSNYASNIMSYKYSCKSGILYYNIYQSNLDCSVSATSIIDYSANVDEFSCSPYTCNYVGYTYWYNDDCNHNADFTSNAFVTDQCLYNSYNNKYQKVTCTQDSLEVITYIDDECIEKYHYTPSPLTNPPTPPPISVCLEISHCQTLPNTKLPQSTPSNHQSKVPSSSPNVISSTSSGIPSLPTNNPTNDPTSNADNNPTNNPINVPTIYASNVSSNAPSTTLNKNGIDSKWSLDTMLLLVIGILILCLCICGIYVYHLKNKRGHRFEKGLENHVEENEIEMETEETNNNKYIGSTNINQSDETNTASITLLENN